MTPELKPLLEKYNLGRIQNVLEKYLLPCVSFDLTKPRAELPIGLSKVGGNPDLPKDFVWFENKGRPLDFLLQINLAAASTFDRANLLPKNGLLSFFYDFEDQPWGYDPNDLSGYKVVYSPPGSELQKRRAPDEDYRLDEFGLEFRSGLSIPQSSSIIFEKFDEEAGMDKEETENYWKLAAETERLNSKYAHRYGGHHRLLGHAENIQGDMQLEAQLVMNGLYCGDGSAYNDPRAEILEKDAGDWTLLLQLDSDDTGNLIWSDCGMLYYWIRKQDLARRDFDNVWMTLQSS